MNKDLGGEPLHDGQLLRRDESVGILLHSESHSLIANRDLTSAYLPFLHDIHDIIVIRVCGL
jgi:hypothetical protein